MLLSFAVRNQLFWRDNMSTVDEPQGKRTPFSAKLPQASIAQAMPVAETRRPGSARYTGRNRAAHGNFTLQQWF